MIDVNRGDNKGKPSEGEQLLQLFVQRMMPELAHESDERIALRKALLMLILCTQDDARFGTEELIQFLLGAFQPLSSAFDGHKHPLYREHAAARGVSGDKLVITVSKALVDELRSEQNL
jgi:hypothetical protein